MTSSHLFPLTLVSSLLSLEVIHDTLVSLACATALWQAGKNAEGHLRCSFSQLIALLLRPLEDTQLLLHSLRADGTQHNDFL